MISFIVKKNAGIYLNQIPYDYSVEVTNRVKDIGHIFVDCCINQLGELEQFISVYCDSVTVADVYGKSVDELVIEACTYNTDTFYKD